MSLLSLFEGLLILFALGSLVALFIKQRKSGGLTLNLILLVIVIILLLTVFSLGRIIAIMLGAIALLSLFISMLLTRRAP